jgi:nicotinate-nucleotide adenylyltransferase
MRSIALFGGTFNPVHKGHTRLLEAVMSAVPLDEVIVMPSKLPPHKEVCDLASESDRLEMCRLAFGGFKNVRVSDYEFTREGKSYSYYTVRHLLEEYPEDRLYFVMGSDMLLSFESWYRADELIKMCTPICVSRSAEDTAAARIHAKELSVIGKALFVEAEPFEVSSTQIRDMIYQKKFTNLCCYLDENVVKYISDRNLYRRG